MLLTGNSLFDFHDLELSTETMPELVEELSPAQQPHNLALGMYSCRPILTYLS